MAGPAMVSLAEVIRSRVSRLSEPASCLLQVLSVAARPIGAAWARKGGSEPYPLRALTRSPIDRTALWAESTAPSCQPVR